MGELPPPFMRLGLSDEQRTEIAAIFQQGRPLTDSILQEVMPHLQAINDSIHGRIREILTPEQAAMLDEEYERRGMPPGGRDWRLRRPFLTDSPPSERMRPRRPDR
jgi:Spy/CpxP family protein refolding chaperone